MTFTPGALALSPAVTCIQVETTRYDVRATHGVDVHTHTYMRTYTHACIHTHIHTYIHTYICVHTHVHNTYTHTHTGPIHTMTLTDLHLGAAFKVLGSFAGSHTTATISAWFRINSTCATRTHG